MSSINLMLFGVLPYLAFFTFLLVTIHRYRAQTFTYSALSSQLLENQQHFWGLVPFHYGILLVLLGHGVAWLFPKAILAWNEKAFRLYLLELLALVFGLLSLVGLGVILQRRLRAQRVTVVTSVADWVLYLLLLVQVASGVLVAVLHPWGSSWFASVMAPYLWSLVKLSPDLTAVAAMPWIVKLHVVNAYLLIGFFPFTRLVHILVVPNPYLWRKPQVVRWYHRPGKLEERL